MKLLVIDVYGTGVDLCLRAQWAGHQVKHFLSPSKRPSIGKGLTTRVQDWRQHMRWADLIVCTASAKYAWELEDWYEKGFPIFGANEDSAAWELDRCVGMEVLQAHGIECLPYRRFENYDDAISYVKATNGSYVCKPIGDADRALSYVGKGSADMVSQLNRAKKVDTKKQPFILQERAEGIEMAVAGWFGKNGWVGPWEENFEHKKFMAGDIGQNTGEMGTAMKYTDQSKLADMMLKPLTTALHALKFKGNVDVSVIIDKDGTPWPLEFTMRLGWPAFYLNQHLHMGDPVEWMRELIDGGNSLRVNYSHCIGVCVVGPSFPSCHVHHSECDGIPLFGINTSNIDKVHLVEVMAGTAEVEEDGKWSERDVFHTAGDWPLVVVDTGSSVCDAAAGAYKVVKDLVIPNSPTYRHDIGKRLKEQLPVLKKLGYAKSWEYGHE
jgi:phosphoribosylamine--glycine ligase